jgi:hypothetical protein
MAGEKMCSFVLYSPILLSCLRNMSFTGSICIFNAAVAGSASSSNGT